MHQINLKLSEQLILSSKMEPMVDTHESTLREIKYIVKDVHSSDILTCQQAIERLKSEKVEKIQHEQDLFTLKTALYDQQDMATHYKS